jgi:anti-sigma B factor antagonist
LSSFSVAFRPRPDEDVMVLDLSGELDAHTAPEFEAALDLALAGGHTRLVVNGADLQYVSSAGLGVFMAFVEPLRERGGDLKVAALQPRVYEVFDLLGFPLIFEVRATEEEAAATFGAAPDAA